MQARARRIVTEVLNPAYRRHLDFYRTEYQPHCARSDSISAQPGGAEYYAFQVRANTTTDLTPRQIHDIGLREVARIRAEMETVAREAGSPSREAYIRELRTNPRYYATEPEQLMRETARVLKTIDGQLPAYFGTLPRLELRHPRDPGRDRRGHDHRLLQSGRARERHRRHLLRQHLQARPAPALGGSRAQPARGGPRPSSPDRAPAGDGHRPVPAELRLLHRLHRRLGPLCREPGPRHGPLQHARAADGRAFLPDVAGDAGWWSTPASMPSIGTRRGRSPS